MSYRITSKFGVWEEVRDGAHTGIDLAMPIGTNLRSIATGKVTKIFNDNVTGRGVLIEGKDGREYLFGHMDEVIVKYGETVKVGELIGFSGNTGNSTGPHLHFAIRENGQYIDPAPYINSLTQITGDIEAPWTLYQGGSNTREELSKWANERAACERLNDSSILDLDDKLFAGLEETACLMKVDMKQQVHEFLDVIGNTLVELSYGVALLGGGALVLLRVVGMTRATKYFGVLQLVHLILRAILGGR